MKLHEFKKARDLQCKIKDICDAIEFLNSMKEPEGIAYRWNGAYHAIPFPHLFNVEFEVFRDGAIERLRSKLEELERQFACI